MPNYPDIEGFAYSFSRAELHVAGRIFTAIKSVEASQPTEVGAVHGTRSYPLAQTVGRADIGEGTVHFSDEAERAIFFQTLGQAYRERVWTLTWILTAPRRAPIAMKCIGCRVVDDPTNHEEGADALGGEVKFKFMRMERDGLRAHSR